MTPPELSTQSRDRAIIGVAVVFILLAVGGTAFIKRQDLKAQQEAEVVKAEAEQDANSIDWLTACVPDLNRFCPTRYNGLGCLKAHMASLSSLCAARIRYFELESRWRRACSQDAARLCPGVSEEADRLCLAQHQQDLSVSCQIYYAAQSASAK